MLAVQVLINETVPSQNRDITEEINDVLAGHGFALDVETFAPSAETLSQLGAIDQGRASIKTCQS